MTVFCFNLVNTIITKQAVDRINTYVHKRMTKAGQGDLVNKIERKIANDTESEAYQEKYEEHVGEAYDTVYGELSQQGSFFVHGTQQVLNNILQAKTSHKVAITTFNASIGLVGKVVKELSRNAEGIVDYGGRVVLVTGGLQNNGTMPSHRKNIHLVELQERLGVPKSSIVFVDREMTSKRNAWDTVPGVDNGNFESAALANQCLVAIKMDPRGAWKERVQELAEDQARWFQRDARSKHKFWGSYPVVVNPEDLKLNLQGGVECWQPRGGKITPSTEAGLRPVKIAIYNGEKVKVAETTYDEKGRVNRGAYVDWEMPSAFNPTYGMHDSQSFPTSQHARPQHGSSSRIRQNEAYGYHMPGDFPTSQHARLQHGSSSRTIPNEGYEGWSLLGPQQQSSGSAWQESPLLADPHTVVRGSGEGWQVLPGQQHLASTSYT